LIVDRPYSQLIVKSLGCQAFFLMILKKTWISCFFWMFGTDFSVVHLNRWSPVKPLGLAGSGAAPQV